MAPAMGPGKQVERAVPRTWHPGHVTNPGARSQELALVPPGLRMLKSAAWGMGLLPDPPPETGPSSGVQCKLSAACGLEHRRRHFILGRRQPV